MRKKVVWSFYCGLAKVSKRETWTRKRRLQTHVHTGTRRQSTHLARTHTRTHGLTLTPTPEHNGQCEFSHYWEKVQPFVHPNTWRTVLLGLRFLHLGTILWGPLYERCQIQEFLNCDCFHQYSSLWQRQNVFLFFTSESGIIIWCDNGLPKVSDRSCCLLSLRTNNQI